MGERSKSIAAAWEQLPVGHPIDDGWCKNRVIGAGGMSVVLEVEKDPHLVDAMKIFAAPPMLESRFAQECALTVSLAHPNIVQIKDCRVLPEGLPLPKGTPYVRMERLHGGTVRALLNARLAKLREESPAHPMRPLLRCSDTYRIIDEIGSALALAHDRGIVHRDIKPENIFLHQAPSSPSFQVKLLDFGIAEVRGEATRDGDLVGSPQYMPPEAGLGKAPTPLFDVYSFSVVIYELLTLRAPFQGIRSPADVLRAHRDRPPPPSVFSPWLDKSLDELVLRGLSWDPERRPSHVGELVEGLRVLLRVDADPARYRLGEVVLTDPEPSALVARGGSPRAAPSPSGRVPNWIEDARARQLQTPAPGLAAAASKPPLSKTPAASPEIGPRGGASADANWRAFRRRRVARVSGVTAAMAAVLGLSWGVRTAWRARVAPPEPRPIAAMEVPIAAHEAVSQVTGPVPSAPSAPSVVMSATSSSEGGEKRAASAASEASAEHARSPARHATPVRKPLARLDDVVQHPPPLSSSPLASAPARETLDSELFGVPAQGLEPSALQGPKSSSLPLEDVAGPK